MTETAAHMSHTLTTDETHYEVHGALELNSMVSDYLSLAANNAHTFLIALLSRLGVMGLGLPPVPTD